MATAKVFMSGRSQAVRLPKEFRVSGNELTITRVGNSLVLTPTEAGWEDFFEALQAFEPGFSIERDQPQSQQERDSMDEP
jgi:antitoxin VapB